MAYSIQAFITGSTNPNLPRLTLPAVALSQDFILVPITKMLQEKYGISFLPLLEGNNNDHQALCNLGYSVSDGTKVAYIEAEFFGGEGTQSSMIFENGNIVSDSIVSANAINLALQHLGVARLSFPDEFDALGLGRCRDTEQWLNA
jgi:hypothetical protein